MEFVVLGSGSKGNCGFIRTDNTRLLIDNGFSGKEAVHRLESVEQPADELDGIIVSHEHGDHIRGVGILARKFKIPVYITEPTSKMVSKYLKHTELRYFSSGSEIRFHDLVIETVPLPHDASDPVGFLLRSGTNGETGGRKLAYITDIGQPTTLVRERLADVDALVIEANHDERMLMNGPYPWRTKQRIKSRFGHLSNSTSAGIIAEVVKSSGIRKVMLAHMSENNNDPELARDSIAQFVKENCGVNISIDVASQHTPAEIIEL